MRARAGGEREGERSRRGERGRGRERWRERWRWRDRGREARERLSGIERERCGSRR